MKSTSGYTRIDPYIWCLQVGTQGMTIYMVSTSGYTRIDPYIWCLQVGTQGVTIYMVYTSGYTGSYHIFGVYKWLYKE